jgi:hypothetical protein
MSDSNKPAWRSPEFMNAMREKSALKRAENKKITEANKLKKQKEHETKLKQAKEVLSPTPPPTPEPEKIPEIEPESDDEEDNIPLPPVEKSKKVKEKTAPTAEPNYKNEYYKHKLEMLKKPKKEPVQQVQAYQVAKHDIQRHVNKEVMHNLWKNMFPDSESPYQ